MNARSSMFAVVVTVFALAGVCVSLSWQGRLDSGNSTLPTGNESPEEAACDFIKAYIEHDFELFKASRLNVVCETPHDVARAYAALVSRAQPVEITLPFSAERPQRIVDVRPALSHKWTPSQKNFVQVYTALNYGGQHCKYVIVTTESASGALARHNVDLIRVGDEWRVMTESLRQLAGSEWFVCPS